MMGFLLLLSLTGLVAYIKMDFKLYPEGETRVIKFHLEFPKNTDLDSMERLVGYATSQLSPP